LELFSAIERLKAKHDEDLKKSRDEFKRIENQYEDRVRDLNFMIDKLKEEMAILERHLRQAEADHHKLSKDKEALVSNLSQQILKLEEIKEEEVKTIGASLKLIEEEAESKLRDLHHAMLNKNE
jgi:predicted RNase H-like nuclease (RuvC/YqgF family)